MRPKAKGYFSGGGLMEIGFMQAGVDVIQSLDIDTKATAVMKMNPHYFNHKVVTDSIENITVLDQDKADIMLFTYPCTKYSAIADIHGTRTGDNLFLHALRHIALELPEMYVVENVPGMKKFKVVMEAMSKLPQYYMNVFCPLDAELWLPQRRKRLILIGTKKPFNISAPKEIICKPRLRDILEQNPEVEMPDYVLSRINGKYRDKPIIVDPENINAVAPTCVAHYSKDMGTRLVKDKHSKYGLRPFSVLEYARLQGVPDDYHFENTRDSYRIIGNGVAVPVGRWCGEQAVKYFNA